MTEKTIKELLEMEFFPTDDQGRQLVPNGNGEVTIIATDGPGDYPIIGVGPYGYAVQFDEDGVMRADTARTLYGEQYVMSEQSVDLNSLIPPDIQRIVQFVIVEADGTVDCSYDTREEAEDHLGFGEQIVELDGYGYVREITDASDEYNTDDGEGTTDFDDAPSPYIFHYPDPAETAQASNAYSPGLYPRFPWTRG